MTIEQHHCFDLCSQDACAQQQIQDLDIQDTDSIAWFGPQHSCLDVEYHILTHVHAVAYLSQS